MELTHSAQRAEQKKGYTPDLILSHIPGIFSGTELLLPREHAINKIITGKEQTRGLALCMKLLGISDHNYFGNKLILDLGASLDCKPAQELRKFDPTATLISFSPDFSSEHYSKYLPKDLPILAGLGQSLPFSGNTFDSVLMVHTLEWIPEPDQSRVLQEIWRILKPGGELRIYPAVMETPLTGWTSLTRIHTQSIRPPTDGRSIINRQKKLIAAHCVIAVK